MRAEFGEEPVVVLVKESLPKLLLGKDLLRLLRLEGCLSGKVPKGVKPLPGACEELAATRAGHLPRRPGDLPQRGGRADRRTARTAVAADLAARTVPRIPARGGDQIRDHLGCPASPTKNSSRPSSSTCAKARGTPKARLAYLFPNAHSAQIVIRLKPDLSEAERRRAIGLIKEAVAETTPRKACAEERQGRHRASPCTAANTWSPARRSSSTAIARALKHALLLLFGVAVVVMAIVLLLAFRTRMRLLPLALALASAALVFGLLELVGGSPDDGLDRRPADPDRPRRRLRDPVPGPLRRGASDRSDAARRQPGRPRTSPAPRSPRPASPPPPASWCSSSRRPRWSEASASSWSSASSWPSSW